MQLSIRGKLLLLCTLLVLFTSSGLSITYYVLSAQEKKLELRERIQITFEIIFDDITQRRQQYSDRIERYLEQDDSLFMATGLLPNDDSESLSTQSLGPLRSLFSSQLRLLRAFASFDRIALYTPNGRLLSFYQPTPDDSPTSDLAAAFPRQYERTLPEATLDEFFIEDQQIGIRLFWPLTEEDQVQGVIIGDAFWTPEMFERYTQLSKADINVFAGIRYSLGSLPEHSALELEVIRKAPTCSVLMVDDIHNLAFSQVTLNGEPYYQSVCQLKAGREAVGALTVNFSQAIERQAIRKIRNWVLAVSALTLGIGGGLSFLFSRKTIQSIQNIVRVIGMVSDGDFRPVSIIAGRDEIGRLAGHLHQMTDTFRNITEQVQQAASVIAGSSDIILEQSDGLLVSMEQQSGSVENVGTSLEAITQFIDVVSGNTNELLSASSQILASIQETHASISAVTHSTGALSEDLQRITGSIEQVEQTIKHVSEQTMQLDDAATYTEAEIQRIDESLQELSGNADQTQHLANETSEAATRGQQSVEASLQGMIELKDVISETAQIVQEVNSWGGQVSSFLGIVDDITEQTSLLALNASIISAQAGERGRGFAVVAAEIKELATRTKSSTKEINTLVDKLQKKTADGVSRIEVGLRKADQGIVLANAVQEAFGDILERATRSSKRAADTTQVVQKTVAGGQLINSQITRVTEMVSDIKRALQQENVEVGQVAGAVERIRDMAEQVNRANREQELAAHEIERSMGYVAVKFSDISEQTATLQAEAREIMNAMQTIDSVTEQTLQNAALISGDSVKNLVRQSDVLGKIVAFFRIT